VFEAAASTEVILVPSNPDGAVTDGAVCAVAADVSALSA
jgi:hypothetical protein